jgi:hypothetical protein
MALKEIVCSFLESYKLHKYILWSKCWNLNVNVSGTYNDHCALKAKENQNYNSRDLDLEPDIGYHSYYERIFP